jgi:hypothetical protein
LGKGIFIIENDSKNAVDGWYKMDIGEKWK